jgi:predicted nucleic acid-binding protein
MPLLPRGAAEPGGYRDRALLPRLGKTLPPGRFLYDTNVFIHALARRRSPLPALLLNSLDDAYVSGPTRAELAWLLGRLDPAHPNTAMTVTLVRTIIGRTDPDKILNPTRSQWLEAGTLAGHAARAIAGGGKSITTAAERQELIGDAMTAVLAHAAGCTIITEDADFDVLGRFLPRLSVLFYDRET